MLPLRTKLPPLTRVLPLTCQPLLCRGQRSTGVDGVQQARARVQLPPLLLVGRHIIRPQPITARTGSKRCVLNPRRTQMQAQAAARRRALLPPMPTPMALMPAPSLLHMHMRLLALILATPPPHPLQRTGRKGFRFGGKGLYAAPLIASLRHRHRHRRCRRHHQLWQQKQPKRRRPIPRPARSRGTAKCTQ